MCRPAIWWILLIISPALGCHATTPPPAPHTAWLEAIDGDDAEARYHAVLRLGRYDSRTVRARLRDLLEAEEPLLRNAAARALVDLGVEDAAATLIANLHGDQRTFVTMDAIFHLRAMFGVDLGYDANKGYRHQTETLERWWRWWEARGHARPTREPAPDEHADLRADLAARVDAYAAAGDAQTWEETAALWTALGEIAPSRNPADVAVVARGFGAMARRFPDRVSLWNNHALASLNDGRYEDALAAYRRAIALAPEDAQLANDLGILLEALGRLEQAEAAYRRATQLKPDDDVPRSNRGDVLGRLGRKAEAIASYREAEHLAPEKWYYHRLWIERLGGR